jgi:hypothetical protein
MASHHDHVIICEVPRPSEEDGVERVVGFLHGGLKVVEISLDT